jgi:hypothetical protein
VCTLRVIGYVQDTAKWSKQAASGVRSFIINSSSENFRKLREYISKSFSVSLLVLTTFEPKC